jgi:hypothetical protein
MTEWDSTHSNINLKTFDIVMTPSFGGEKDERKKFKTSLK